MFLKNVIRAPIIVPHSLSLVNTDFKVILDYFTRMNDEVPPTHGRSIVASHIAGSPAAPISRMIFCKGGGGLSNHIGPSRLVAGDNTDDDKSAERLALSRCAGRGLSVSRTRGGNSRPSTVRQTSLRHRPPPPTS